MNINLNADLENELKEIILDNENLYQNMLDILNKSDENKEIDESIEEKNDMKIKDENEISNEETEMISNDDKDEIEELPEYIKIIIKILKEILKFVSSKEQVHKILSIECLTIGIPLLKDYENELLPLVHLIWYPFNERFNEKDSIVLNRCFDLLQILCVYAKDFILQRSLKYVPIFQH